MKFNKKAKYLLVGFSIIGALAIIAGSTAAVTIHSNNKLVAKSATTNSTNTNASNPSKSSGTTKNSSANSPAPSTPDASKTNSAGDQGKNSNSNPDKTPLNKDSSAGHETSGKTSSGSTKNSTSPDKTGSNGPGVPGGPGPVQTNPNGEKSSDGSNALNPNDIYDNNQIIKNLDSLLNLYIKVSGFSNTNANNALNNSSSNNLINAIKTGLLNELKTAVGWFYYVSNSSSTNVYYPKTNYDINYIVNHISIELPTGVNNDSNELGEISGIKLSYDGTVLTNTSETDSFIAQGFLPILSAGIINEINQHFAQMIQTNVDKIITQNAQNKTVYTFNPNNSFSIKENNLNIFVPSNAIVITGLQLAGDITATEALNISYYWKLWTNYLETLIVGSTSTLFTYTVSSTETLTFTQQQIAANLSILINQHQSLNTNGEIEGMNLAYSGIYLNFTSSAFSQTWNANYLNVYGFFGYDAWQNEVKQIIQINNK